MSGIEYQTQIDKALELRDAGNNKESINILSKIYKHIPLKDVKATVVAGLLFKEANELSKALYCFQKSVEVDAISPRASLGLFHTLWRLEEYDKGFDELERFFSLAVDKKHLELLEKDRAHFELLEDMREQFFGDSLYKSEEPLNLIKKLRNDLHNDLANENIVNET